MKVHALILGNIAPLSGCEFKNSKALEMIAHLGIRFIYHTSVDFVTCEDQPAHRTISSAPLFQEQNIKHFVGPDLSPNCLLN